MDAHGQPRPVDRIGLDAGVQPAGVGQIEPDDSGGPSAPWAGDLLVSDPSANRILHLRRIGGAWQNAGFLATGQAPGPIVGAIGGRIFAGWWGVVNAGSDTLSLFARDGAEWRTGGQRPVGVRPVAATDFGLPSSGDDAIAIANAGSDSLTILSGPGFRRRQDIPVGHEPSAVAAWDLDSDVTLAVADSASAAVTIVTLRYRRKPRITTVSLPGTRPVAVALDRFDRDGRVDLAVADAAGRRLYILHGAGSGRFLPGTVLDLPDEPVALHGGIDENYSLAVLGRAGTLSIFVAVDDVQLGEQGVAIAAGAGRVLWSARPHGAYRLIQRRRNLTEPLAGVGASRQPIRVRFGRGPRGALSISYLRCHGQACLPYRYDFARHREVRLHGIAVPRGCRLTAVATWGSRVAYVLDHRARRRSCRRDAIGVWLRGGRVAHRLGDGFDAHLGSLTAHLLGWSQWRGSPTRPTATVQLADTRTGHMVTVFRAGPAAYLDFDGGFDVTAPIIDGHAVYWASVGTSSIAVDTFVELYRQTGLRRPRCRRHVAYNSDSQLGIPPSDNAVDFAVDHGHIFYVTNSKPYAADMSRVAPRLACSRRR